MSLNMKTLTQALAKTAAVIEKTVQTTVQEVTGPRPLQDYDLLDQVGSGGPGLAWKLYAARPRPSAPSTQYPLVCVWVLDKRVLSEARTRAGLSKASEEGFLDIVRADASRLVRIRHPGVVHVVQALDESKNAMAMVTEPLFASVANTLGNLENVITVPKELKGMEMGLLEVKHGLLQIAESLDFLHNNAHLIHRAISPETVFITSSGAWKLGGFGFAIPVDQASSGLTSTQTFHYPEYDVEDSVLPLQPSLNYTAPELVRSKSNTVGCAVDIFSFGCLAYHLVARKPLLDCRNNVKMYMNTLTYLSSEAFSPIIPELVADLQRMLSMNDTSRPSALEFTGSSFFRDDTRLRALRFLDHLLERDNMQKTEFLKALSDMWKDFDSRVLRYKETIDNAQVAESAQVLPPLCAELRNMVMQPMILPMVLTIAESQDKNDFEISTLPALVPVLNSASGETLLLLLKHADLIINKASQDHLVSHLLPLLVRAYDDNDARIQEEVLRRTTTLAKKLAIQLVKQDILARVHGLALRTTVAAVRVNALRCLGDLVASLDKQSVLDILQTLQRCTAVDRSAPTLMCTLGVSHAIFKQFGLEFAVEHVLPLLFPLLTAQQLSVQQFAKYMLFVKDILRKVEEKRGVTLTEPSDSEVRTSPSLTNGLHSEQPKRPMDPTLNAKTTSSWDEDWGPISSTNVAASKPSKQSISTSQPAQVTLTSIMNPSSSPVSVEWPPSNASSAVISQPLAYQKHVEVKMDTAGPSDATFDDIDPFANWPPKTKNSLPSFSHGLSSSNTSKVSLPIPGANNHADVNSVSIGLPNQAIMESSTATMDPFFGMAYANSGGIGQPIGKRPSSSLGNPTPRIAPPPVTATGRGRGRNQMNKKNEQALGPVSSEQPPLLDLL